MLHGTSKCGEHESSIRVERRAIIVNDESDRDILFTKNLRTTRLFAIPYLLRIFVVLERIRNIIFQEQCLLLPHPMP